jgi:hypothetical protein
MERDNAECFEESGGHTRRTNPLGFSTLREVD